MCWQQLKKAGDEAVPLLQTALQDDDFLFHRYGTSVLDGSVIETALNLLEPFALPEARLLEPVFRHADDFFRYRSLYISPAAASRRPSQTVFNGMEEEAAGRYAPR